MQALSAACPTALPIICGVDAAALCALLCRERRRRLSSGEREGEGRAQAPHKEKPTPAQKGKGTAKGGALIEIFGWVVWMEVRVLRG
jgi:hypothetical protein